MGPSISQTSRHTPDPKVDLWSYSRLMPLHPPSSTWALACPRAATGGKPELALRKSFQAWIMNTSVGGWLSTGRVCSTASLPRPVTASVQANLEVLSTKLLKEHVKLLFSGSASLEILLIYTFDRVCMCVTDPWLCIIALISIVILTYKCLSFLFMDPWRSQFVS